ncbi:hypothetical protein [uncultured Tateyamaria sp.]|uniref:hypothetical protein n=1 Tax=uncultured Tateyamaria sp. TaxID=455651 RepID=UPI002631DE9C|nr:hypothetical protein [uncultured Tateyamaria sp.]
MTAFTDTLPDIAPADPARTVDGQRMLIRGAQRLVGVALVLAAFGLWIEPGAIWDADLALFKFALSLAIGFAGLICLQSARAVVGVEVEIDTVRREVRLVRGSGRARTLVSRTRIRDLGPAEWCGAMVRLWAHDGALVAEVALSDPALRKGLIDALRDEGKL